MIKSTIISKLALAALLTGSLAMATNAHAVDGSIQALGGWWDAGDSGSTYALGLRGSLGSGPWAADLGWMSYGEGDDIKINVDEHQKEFGGIDANVFDLGINIFNINGELLKEATEHVKLIPKPHINPEEMGRFKRPSESLDTYYSLTGLRNMAYLDSLVIAYYGNTNRHEYYCMIFDYTGEPLLPGVITTENMIPGLIVGFNHNELYCSVVSEQSGKTFANTPNPFLVVYNLKPDIE